jgi:hypothetical protein
VSTLAGGLGSHIHHRRTPLPQTGFSVSEKEKNFQDLPNVREVLSLIVLHLEGFIFALRGLIRTKYLETHALVA